MRSWGWRLIPFLRKRTSCPSMPVRPSYWSGTVPLQPPCVERGPAGPVPCRRATSAKKLDFIACAEFLVREGYTRPARLAALSGSAGGITVGRAITERPDLFAAAVIQNGALDAVRLETTPGGPPNTHEFGSVATEEGFRALLAMSAVHHVHPGTAYPAVLLATGLNDTRVAPWQSGKMAAALQAATPGGRSVLLRVDEAAGHMPQDTADEQLRQLLTDFYAFLMAQTGMPAYRAPAPPGR